MSPRPQRFSSAAGLPLSLQSPDGVSVGPNQPKPQPMSQPTLGFWKLTFAIAAGIWLGSLAVAATAWLIWPDLPPAVIARLAQPSAGTPASPLPARSNEEMFQQYLQRQQATQEQKSEQGKRFNGAPCQFWLQQYQANPTEGNREKMDGYCG